MNLHPAKTIIIVWGLCIFAYIILPYQLLGRQLSGQGFAILALFMAAFLLGTLLVPLSTVKFANFAKFNVDSSLAEKVLMSTSLAATIFFLLDAKDKNIFDLAVAYELRSETADALLKAEVSNSTIWFQASLLLYPSAYIFAAAHILYARKINILYLLLFGLVPIALATLAMGGRNPIFYLVLVAWLCYRERDKILPGSSRETKSGMGRKIVAKMAWALFLAILLYYFVAVFMVRAAVAGGSMEMFAVAEERWGIGFKGLFSGLIFEVLGEDLSYLLFIFVWYLIQGLVMSNYIFSSYEGPMQFGIYGIDLASALMRRIDPQRVADGFDALLTLGTYGFLPSAWGSLYVDFGLFGVVFCVFWGVWAALCHRRVVIQRRADWLLIGPFVTIGIALSVINTPLGFTNGLVTHVWLAIAFVLLKFSSFGSPLDRHS